MQNIRGLLIKFILPLLGIATVAAGGLYFAAPDKFQQLIPFGTTSAKIFLNLKTPTSANFSYEPPVLQKLIKIHGTIFNDTHKFSKVKLSLNLSSLLKDAPNKQELPINIDLLSVEIIANSQNAYVKAFVAQRNQLQEALEKSTHIPAAMLSTYIEPAISVLSGEKYLKIDKQDIQKYSDQKLDYSKSMASPETYMDLLKLVYNSLDVSKPERTSLDGQTVYKMRIHVVKSKLLKALQQAKQNKKLLKELELTEADLNKLITKVQNTETQEIEFLYLDMYFQKEGKFYYVAALSPSLKLNNEQKNSIQKILTKLNDEDLQAAKELKTFLTNAINTGFLNLGMIKYTDINKVSTSFTAPDPSKTVSLDQFASSIFYLMMATNNSKYRQNSSNPLNQSGAISPTPSVLPMR